MALTHRQFSQESTENKTNTRGEVQTPGVTSSLTNVSVHSLDTQGTANGTYVSLGCSFTFRASKDPRMSSHNSTNVGMAGLEGNIAGFQ